MAKDEELLAHRAHDKVILLGIIRDIGGQLRMIVFERQDLFRGEYRQLFPGPWQEIEGHLNEASHEIEAMQSDDTRWKYVEGAGLVGEQLKFKKNMLTTAIERGPVARLLKVMNSILGSLSGAFPVLEAVKEYKEHVEAAIAVQNRWKWGWKQSERTHVFRSSLIMSSSGSFFSPTGVTCGGIGCMVECFLCVIRTCLGPSLACSHGA